MSESMAQKAFELGLRAQRSGHWKAANAAWAFVAWPLVLQYRTRKSYQPAARLVFHEQGDQRKSMFALIMGEREFRIPARLLNIQWLIELLSVAERMRAPYAFGQTSARRKLTDREPEVDHESEFASFWSFDGQEEVDFYHAMAFETPEAQQEILDRRRRR